jgi:hypothetical protein
MVEGTSKVEEGNAFDQSDPSRTDLPRRDVELEEGEEKTEEDVATDLPKSSSKGRGEPPQQPSSFSVGKTIDDTFRLTRQNLTAVPAAVADGFWHTKDSIEGTGGVVVHKTTELMDVRNWRCIAISGLLTCSFYTCLIVTIPVVIIIVLVLTIWKYDKDGGGKLVGNITEPFRRIRND